MLQLLTNGWEENGEDESERGLRKPGKKKSSHTWRERGREGLGWKETTKILRQGYNGRHRVNKEEVEDEVTKRISSFWREREREYWELCRIYIPI